MATLLSIADTIEVGDISGPLSALYVDKKTLFGGSVIKPKPPIQITIATDALRWSQNSMSAIEQRQLANYLYWMCGVFQLQAQNIISGPGGGSVIPISGGAITPNDLDFIVSALTIIPTGGTSLFIPQFIGYNVDFARNGIIQYTTPQLFGSTYYSWNNVTGLFQIFNGAAAEGESFRIMVDAGGGVAGVIPTQTYPFIITSADFEPDGITYNNAAIVGDEIMMFVSGFNSEWQFAGVFFDYTANGIIVTFPGFDAANFGNIIIQKIN